MSTGTQSSTLTVSTRTARSWAAQSATSRLAPFSIQRREPLPSDISIEILFCGVCHSDLHQARNEWKGSSYPMVPGHEIVGRVVSTGGAVTKFRVGDFAAVGCLVDSCRTCTSCRRGLEQFCLTAPVFTYNSPDRHLGGLTYGGYSDGITVDEAFALKVAPDANLAATAPLLCAGITTYSPLRHWNAGPGKKVGIIGLGGLGHMGVKLAHAMAAHVVLFTTSPGKVEDGRKLGADEVVISKDSAAMSRHRGSFDLIVDCVSAQHDLGPYFDLLQVDGTLVLVGLPEDPLSVAPFYLVGGRRSFAGSCIGGIAETQEMLDFCAARGIASDIETIAIQQVNEAFERLLKNDVKYRFVIDLASLKG